MNDERIKALGRDAAHTIWKGHPITKWSEQDIGPIIADAIRTALTEKDGGNAGLLKHLKSLSIEQQKTIDSFKTQLAVARDALERIKRFGGGSSPWAQEQADCAREALAKLKGGM